MPLVYRFENSQGEGPWSGRASCLYDVAAAKTNGREHSCYDMPCLHDVVEEGKPAHRHFQQYGVVGYRFGFTSKAQLKRAFPSSVGRAAMGEAGQVLKVYEVPERVLLRGAAQCIFKKEHARLVGTLDMKTLKAQS